MNRNQNSNVETNDDDQSKQEDTPQSSSTNQTSSSSATTGTSSSGGTGTTVSSADTVPTQEAGQTCDEYVEAETPSWGILYPIDRNFYPMDLREDNYTFGRAKSCQYSLDVPTIKSTENFKSYSSTHFSITRTKNGSGGSYTIMINDLSLNGTFVNGEKLPLKGSRQMYDKDEIGMNSPNLRALLFVDKNKEEDPNLPQEFKDKYIMHKVIGNGAFGEVREALSKFDTQRHAVKIINKQKTIFASQNPSTVNNDVMKEARLLLTLHHPCIISVHDVINSPKNLYIVLELACGGELFTRVAKKAFPEPVAKLLFFQMLSAVAYLHDSNVTHRDLKPENILMMSDELECLIKITDFGVSRLVGEESFMKTQAGTPSYLAPEILRSFRSKMHEGYTRQVDSWSLGVILYVCLAGYPPFARDRIDTELDLVMQIINGDYNFNNPRWSDASESAKDMIRCLLQVDAKERLTPKQALDHAWLKDDAMKLKAKELMSSAHVHGQSLNSKLLKQTEEVNPQSSGINFAVQEKEISSASNKSDNTAPVHGVKRPLSTSSEGSRNSEGSGEAPSHTSAKHFARASPGHPDTPKPTKP